LNKKYWKELTKHLPDIERAQRALHSNIKLPKTTAGINRSMRAAVRILSRNNVLDKDAFMKATGSSSKFIAYNIYKEDCNEDATTEEA
jgi:hypothetical protein